MSKPKKPEVKYEGKIFPVGTRVKIIRPNLAYGKLAVVNTVNPATGVHLIRVTATNGAEYSALAMGGEMEEVK